MGKLEISKQEEELVREIESAEQFLILTHTNLDHDAISSMLLVKYILEQYFGKKDIDAIVQEEKWPQYESLGLPGLDEIQNISKDTKPDLSKYDAIILVDARELHRTIDTKYPGDENDLPIISFDHHASEAKTNQKLVFNDKLSSAAEQIYTTFKNITRGKVTKDKVVARLTQVGIIADTGRFLYTSITKPSTFRVMAELYETERIDIEKLYYGLLKNTRNSLFVFNHLVENTRFESDMAYSHISPKFMTRNKFTSQDRESARDMFLQFYLRSIEGTNWGFIVRETSKPGLWHVSFRATSGTKEVRKIAEALGGGGHKYSAAADFEAENVDAAVQKVLDVINA